MSHITGYRGSRFFSSQRRNKKNAPVETPSPPFRRGRVMMIFFIASWGSIAYLLLFHSYFRISNVYVTGLERISSSEIQTTVEGIISSKHFYVLPGDSFVLTGVGELAEILQKRFPIQHIVVTKSFPHTVSIHIKERISRVVYDNKSMYALVSESGSVTELLRHVGEDEWLYSTSFVSSTADDGTEFLREEKIATKHVPNAAYIEDEIGEYPVVLQRNKGAQLAVNDSVARKESIGEIIEWYNLLPAESLHMKFVEIDEQGREGLIITHEGLSLFVTLLSEERQRQVDAIRHTRSGTSASHIDVRYDGKIYWK